MSTGKIKVGYVGSGLSFTVFHYPLTSTLSSQFVPTALFVNSDKSAAEAEADKSHDLILYRDLAEMIRSVDLVCLCSPPAYHLEQAKLCIDLGKHCIVEKPVVGSIEEARKLLELVESESAKGLVISVFQNRRFDGNFLTLRKLIREKTLGDIVQITSRFDRFRPEAKKGNHWKEQANQGGLLLDLGSHLVDQIVTLYGEPSRLNAIVQHQRGFAANDFLNIQLDYALSSEPGKQSPLCIVQASSLVANPFPRFEVHGTKGSWVTFGEDVQEAQIKSGMSASDAQFGVYSEPSKLYTADGESDVPVEKGNWLEYYRNVADAILNGTPLLVTVKQAIEVFELLDKSLQQN